MKAAIIFDLDGTLWDTRNEVKKVWNKIAKSYDLDIKDEQINDIMGLTKEEIINYFFANAKLGEEFITKCQNKENEYLTKFGGKIYKNAIKTIKMLYKNYNLFIVSNCQAGYIEAFINYYRLKGYFKDYESSGNTGEDKESNIRMILKRNKIKNAIYVGDTSKDYLAATKNNIKFIWAKYGFGICNCYDAYINDILDLYYKINDVI